MSKINANKYNGHINFLMRHNWYDDITSMISIDFDNPGCENAIINTVEFMGGWKSRLITSDGDYVLTYLQMLASAAIDYANEYPSDNISEIIDRMHNTELWYWKLDGTNGIRLINAVHVSHRDDEFEIEKMWPATT